MWSEWRIPRQTRALTSTTEARFTNYRIPALWEQCLSMQDGNIYSGCMSALRPTEHVWHNMTIETTDCAAAEWERKKKFQQLASSVEWCWEEIRWCNTVVNMRFKLFWNMCRDQNQSELILETNGKVRVWSISVLYLTENRLNICKWLWGVPITPLSIKFWTMMFISEWNQLIS